MIFAIIPDRRILWYAAACGYVGFVESTSPIHGLTFTTSASPITSGRRSLTADPHHKIMSGSLPE
jgi:hypothetical protein